MAADRRRRRSRWRSTSRCVSTSIRAARSLCPCCRSPLPAVSPRRHVALLPASGRDEGTDSRTQLHPFRSDGVPMAPELSDCRHAGPHRGTSRLSPLLSIVGSRPARADLRNWSREPIFWQADCDELRRPFRFLLLFFRWLFRVGSPGARAMPDPRRQEKRSQAAAPARALRSNGKRGPRQWCCSLLPIVLATGWFMALEEPFGDAWVTVPRSSSRSSTRWMSLPFVTRVLEPAYGIHHRRTPRLRAGASASPALPASV